MEFKVCFNLMRNDINLTFLSDIIFSFLFLTVFLALSLFLTHFFSRAGSLYVLADIFPMAALRTASSEARSTQQCGFLFDVSPVPLPFHFARPPLLLKALSSFPSSSALQLTL